MLEEKKSKVAVWLVKCNTKDDLELYMKEECDPDDDSPPSEFAKEFKIDWYDHDYVERQFKGSVSSHSELFQDMFEIEQIFPQLTEKADKIKDLNKFTGFITICDCEYVGQISETKNSLFLGNFDYVDNV